MAGEAASKQGRSPPGLSSHNAQEQNNLLNYPSQSLAGLSMRLVTTFNFTYWLLCVFWLSPSSHYSLQAARTSCDAGPAAEAGLMADSKHFLFSLAPSTVAYLSYSSPLTHSSVVCSCGAAQTRGALAGLGPPVAMVSMAAPVFSGISSSARVRITSAGVSQMKMAPSEPAVTMNFWLGEMAIYKTVPNYGMQM